MHKRKRIQPVGGKKVERERQKKVKEDHQVFVRRVRWSMYPNLMSVYYMCMYVIEKRREICMNIRVRCNVLFVCVYVLSVQNCRLSR